MSENMDMLQTGFVPKVWSHLNLTQVISRIKRTKKIRGQEDEALFIDFSSAYNTINRQKIYDIMEKKNILESKEILFYEMVEF